MKELLTETASYLTTPFAFVLHNDITDALSISSPVFTLLVFVHTVYETKNAHIGDDLKNKSLKYSRN